MYEYTRGVALRELLPAALCLLSLWAAADFTDGVVASVAGEPILKSEILQEIMPKIQELSASATSTEELERQIEPLFEQAIEHFILYKEAQTLGVEVPEAEVEKRVADVRAQYKSPEEYERALESAGYTQSNFRDRMRRQIMAITVGISKRRQFEKEAVVSESDIAQYYEDNKETFSAPARYRLRRIFIAVPRDEEEQRLAAKEKLTGLREQLLAGSDFSELARTHSEGPEAKEGGLMDWIAPEDLVEPLSSAVADLTVGEMTGVLETDFGVQVLRLEEIQARETAPFAEARKEIEPILRQQQGDKRYRQWMSTLRRRNNIRIFQ